MFLLLSKSLGYKNRLSKEPNANKKNEDLAATKNKQHAFVKLTHWKDVGERSTHRPLAGDDARQ